jgi:hypothetical protein
MSNAASRRRGRLAGAVVPVIVAMAVGAFAISGPARAATASTRPLPGTHPRWATAAAVNTPSWVHSGRCPDRDSGRHDRLRAGLPGWT